MIRVGGSTEVEVKERKDRVDDALHATRAAVEEGIVPGGGVALARASKVLAALKADNDDQRFGIEIVRKAMQTPLRQIAENAGEDGAVISGKILDKDEYNWGFDAQTGEFKDLVKAGIIDPTKVVRTGAAACSLGRIADDHHRGDGRRTAGEERRRRCRRAAAWAAWATWTTECRFVPHGVTGDDCHGRSRTGRGGGNLARDEVAPMVVRLSRKRPWICN